MSGDSNLACWDPDPTILKHESSAAAAGPTKEDCIHLVDKRMSGGGDPYHISSFPSGGIQYESSTAPHTDLCTSFPHSATATVSYMPSNLLSIG